MTNPFKGRTGMNRILRAIGYSIDGLKTAYSGESAFRQEVWLAVLLVPSAFWVGNGWAEVALLIAAVFLVMIVELLNSGIEAAIDRVSLELHDLSKRAKDLASAAVFLSVILCGALWCTALWRRLA